MEQHRKIEELNFYKGEKRFITFEVISTKNERVVISEPSYVMKYDGKTVDEGVCEIINESELQALIEASDVGSFDLEITYTLGAELRKVRCKINVN